MTPEQEIKAIEDAMERNDLGYLERRYRGFGGAMNGRLRCEVAPK